MALLESLVNGKKPARKEGGSFAITMIHYSKLIPSEKNTYSTEQITELAHTILLSGGVKQNLLARKRAPDEYELIAGHRRRLAVQYLVEELGKEEFAMLPVRVEKSGDRMSEINLILTNSGTRERSDWEKMMEVTRLTELIRELEAGDEDERERFVELVGQEPGIGGRRLRSVIAKKLGLSETKVANLNHIQRNLSEELKGRFRAGEIGVSVANAAASLPEEEQERLAREENVRLAAVRREAVSESDTGPEAGRKGAVSESDTGQEAGTEGAVSESDTEPEARAEGGVSESDTQPENGAEEAAGKEDRQQEPTDLEIIRDMLEDANRRLDKLLKEKRRTELVVRRQSLLTAALASMLYEFENMEWRDQAEKEAL